MSIRRGSLLPSAEVVALEAAAEAAGLHAHDRIGLRIEARVAPQDLERDRVRLQAVRATGKRLLDHEAKELLEPIRRDEIRARQDPLQLLPDRLAGRRTPIAIACIARSGIRTTRVPPNASVTTAKYPKICESEAQRHVRTTKPGPTAGGEGAACVMVRGVVRPTLLGEVLENAVAAQTWQPSARRRSALGARNILARPDLGVPADLTKPSHLSACRSNSV